MASDSRRRFLPGDRVVLVSTGECGIVVHAWSSNEVVEDCYVAFFGDQFPPADGAPEKPHILRYAASSLRPAEREMFSGSDVEQAEAEPALAFEVVEARFLETGSTSSGQRWLIRGRAYADIRVGDRLILCGHRVKVEAVTSYGRDTGELSRMMTGDLAIWLPGVDAKLLMMEPG